MMVVGVLLGYKPKLMPSVFLIILIFFKKNNYLISLNSLQFDYLTIKEKKEITMPLVNMVGNKLGYIKIFNSSKGIKNKEVNC